MEAVAAVGLASSIITFIDASGKLIATAKQVYQSADGCSEEASTREAVNRSMQEISKKLLRPGLFVNQGLHDLALECQRLSSEIIAVSDTTKAAKAGSVRAAISAGLRGFTKNSTLLRLEDRLGHCKTQIVLELDILAGEHTAVQLAQLQSILKDDVSYAQEIADNVKRLERGLEWRNEALEQHIRKILRVEQDTLHRAYQDRILRSLRFDSMGSRQEKIRDPRGHTYSWILDHKSQKSDVDHRRTRSSDVARKTEKNKGNARRKFLDWLSSGRDILHISGKLGSGKSTLMKFLFSHKRTRERLERWTEDKKLVLVGFFFWRHGSSLQNSLSGLYRSILHDILEACPEFIPEILPDQWVIATNSPWHIYSEATISMPAADIQGGLGALMHHSNVFSKHRFCLFIDGLDEYSETESEDYRALADLIQGWARFSDGNIKICVSSREENAFMNCFSSDQRIRLHDLTQQDMRDYTQDLLGQTQDSPDPTQSSSLSESLSDEISEKSQGIFLWVVLVVKAIRKEFEAGAIESRLTQILDEMPEGLDGLFQYIIGNLGRRCRTRLFELVLMLNLVKYTKQRRKTIPVQVWLLAYSFIDDYHADPEFAYRTDFPTCTVPRPENLTTRLGRAEKLLRSDSGGLIEAQNSPGEWIHLQFAHRSIPEMFEQGPLSIEMASVAETFDAWSAFSILWLAALRFENGTGIMNSGQWADLLSFLLSRSNARALGLLQRVDSYLDMPSFSHHRPLSLQMGRGFHMQFTYQERSASLSPRRLSTLCLAAYMGNIPFIKWKHGHTSKIINMTELKLASQILLNSNDVNEESFEPLFDTGFFNDDRSTTTLLLSRYNNLWNHYQVPSEGLTLSQDMLATKFLYYCRKRARDAVKPIQLQRAGYNFERFMEKGLVDIDFHITITGPPSTGFVIFRFANGTEARVRLTAKPNDDWRWTSQYLRMRSKIYPDSNDTSRARYDTWDVDNGNGDGLIHQLMYEYSLRDWFESSWFPNTDRLLHLLTENEKRKLWEESRKSETDQTNETNMKRSTYARWLKIYVAVILVSILGYGLYFVC